MAVLRKWARVQPHLFYIPNPKTGNERSRSHHHCREVIGAGATTPRRKEKRGERRMGKVPVRMKAVVYALSPFQQQVMPGLWKDITTKIHHKVSENWISATLLLTPVIGTYQYAMYYKEQEKLSHRY
ncbi:hypothetical protein ACQ4PT_021100 [Festuca glaucescens]